MQKAIFLDKDGTLIEDVPYNVDPARMMLCPRALSGVHKLYQAGYQLIVITNQSGIARGYFDESALTAVEQRLRQMLELPLAGFYYCPHHPNGTVAEYAVSCDCRKPKPGMLLQAAADHDIDLHQSWFIGDILNDVEAGLRAGCRTVLIDNGNETEWVLTPQRTPHHATTNLSLAADYILHTQPAHDYSRRTNQPVA
ncbi:HAD family hydrolase [Pseudanabaena sp. FACHB-2040]|uniref:D-glycero-alpha-D-manno-heptose-1,7-bisphosphate 7-phosphatase n=1 Tax=Pseudanabaena sp. FACHB-2040 TaxID=2692859 RepID=UPI00168437D0|nr:HAD family hydrolase [Pseudanabaena sp. FACHB-2040]MBD2257221.1 HAD family hydrolase [Pseudanabaena sp. FACHB-2040]